MIKLEERQTRKLPGKTSIFVEFIYKPELVDVMHQIPSAIFHKKDKIWEAPVTELSRLINYLHNYDDIDLILLGDEPKKEDKVYPLMDYKTTPYSYQLDGIQFGLNHDKCLILDQPGLGKTIQCIYIAQERYYKGEIEHCLIVCGLNTLKFNWKKEIEQHSDLSAKILGERINRKGRLVVDGVDTRLQQLKEPIEEFFVITNIETLRDDRISKELNKGVNKFDMIVADEIHKMNNITSAQGKNFSKLKSKYKIGLTGTFLVNSPLDAYMALKWVDVDRSTATNFKYFYSVYGGRFGNELIGYKNLEILKDQLSDISIRRTKDILNLPEKNYIHELLEMDDKQSKFYNNIVEGIIEEVDKVNIDKNNVLALTTRLRQSTSDPSILITENIKSAKLLRAKELVQEIISQGEKVIVYTTFKQPLYTLAEELKKYKPLVCTGDTKEEEVWKRVDKFQTDNEHYLMLATIQKMGTGITLTKASYVIFIDSAWTRADNEQAEDRIHRIGAKKPCFYYYLWTKDTYDENVRALVDKKDALSTYINDDELTLDKMETLKKYVTDFKENKISK
nr:MAG TPA: Chromatin remodeling complex ATPase [Caudoviricetes sp.]